MISCAQSLLISSPHSDGVYGEYFPFQRIRMSSKETIFLEGYYEQKDKVTRITAESLIALFTLQCCEDLDANIIFTVQEKLRSDKPYTFAIDNEALYYKNDFIDIYDCPSMIQNCLLPAVYTEYQPMVVVGLSASVRHFLFRKSKTHNNHLSTSLLGFRKGCLQACAESSVWTKFCEIEAVNMLNYTFGKFDVSKYSYVLEQIIKFEYHLQKPPILHNALKIKQKYFKNLTNDPEELLKIKSLTLKELPELEHKYAEGTALTLADIFLYVPFLLCSNYLKGSVCFEEFSPLVYNWLTVLNNTNFIYERKSFFKMIEYPELRLPEDFEFKNNLISIPNESLYKSDPNRYKPRWRSFTHQDDINKIRNKLENHFDIAYRTTNVRGLIANLDHSNYKKNKNHFEYGNPNNSLKETLVLYSLLLEEKLEWESFPKAVIPLDGELPASRLSRKCQQLESLAQIVITIAKDGDKIVDFCSGGGHLGILLAYCLPNCKLLLIENKINSLNKAYSRVKALKLQNVEFYQCNLDYFSGKFDIGICLHACGSATDLVMLKCFLQNASFVCSPCCYGSLKSNHILNYPRSEVYKDLNITLSEYLVIGHTADQTHDKLNPKTEQGKVCMQYIDSDRLFAAKNYGYSVLSCVMNPPECTPKNHILVGMKKTASFNDKK